MLVAQGQMLLTSAKFKLLLCLLSVIEQQRQGDWCKGNCCICVYVWLYPCHRCVQGWWTWEGSRSSCPKPQRVFWITALGMWYPRGITGLCILVAILREKKQENS